MKLLHPSARMIQKRQLVEQGRSKAPGLAHVERLTAPQTIERPGDLGIGPRLGIDPLQAVVRGAAARGVKRGVAALQRLEQLGEASDRKRSLCLETVDPGVPSLWI